MVVRNLNRLARYVDVSQEVKIALEAKKPVVALESTIITHGMPYPSNKETALEVEQIVREQSATPATIGIVRGRLKIGMTPEEIHYLASSKDSTVIIKTSRRDIPYVISKGLSGGTTVSGTMVAANCVGIKVFVTGGIGGVHRGGELTMDVSADLTELGRTPVAVVCSGIKSILDIGRSLEYLETQGVCVATYGPTRDFPAFYCQKSQHKAPYNVNTPEDAAALVYSLEKLEMQNGVVFAVPVPKEHQLIDDVAIENAIQNALTLADEKGIKGKAVTPFILQQLGVLTKGLSLQTNIALIKNNALVGSNIAVALSRLSGGSEKDGNPNRLAHETQHEDIVFARPKAAERNPVVIGGSILDSVVSVQEPFKVEGRTLNGRIVQSGGGVARNLADALGKLAVTPRLVSAVGDDQYGRFILNETIKHLDHEAVLVSRELPTASYTVILDQSGDFRMGVGDLNIHTLISPDHVSRHLQDISAVIMDGNIPPDCISFILDHCSKRRIPVIFEPTDVAKAAIPFQSEAWKSIHLITPNLKELRRIALSIGLDVSASDDPTTVTLEEVVMMATPLAEHIQTVMVTLGSVGVMMVGRLQPGGELSSRFYPCSPLDNVCSVSGAGDCLAAGVISGMLAGLDEPLCISAGLAAAYDSLHCYSAVPPEFTTASKPIQYTQVYSNLKRSSL